MKKFVDLGSRDYRQLNINRNGKIRLYSGADVLELFKSLTKYQIITNLLKVQTFATVSKLYEVSDQHINEGYSLWEKYLEDFQLRCKTVKS
jgi:flagellar biosynthesis protein FlhB